MAAGASHALGQERLLPIRLGRIQFYPSLGVSAAHEDNVERLNEDDPVIGPVDSGIRALGPQLRFDLPFRKSYARLVYRGDFREYSAEALKNLGGASHFLNFTGHFEAGRIMSIDVADRYVDGITGLLNSVPGGEFRYSTQPLKSNDAQMMLTFELGAVHSLEVGGVSAQTHFEESPTATFFFDYETQSLFARYVLSSGAGNEIYASVDRQEVKQDQGSSAYGNSEYRTRSIGTGFRRATSRELISELRVSYSSTEFTQGFGTPFQGVTVEGDLNMLLASGSQIQVRLRRAPLVSFFNVSAYYLNEMAEVNFTQALGRTVVMSVLGGYQYNVYSDTVQVSDPAFEGIFDYLIPSEGERRRDRVLTGAFNLLWRMSRAIDLTVGYRLQKSRSNIVAQGQGIEYDIYDYDSHGVILATVIGWQ